tara:strand:- start:122 stop:763 length:642 start_codon:yes stop_codon:yes gene_type:complete
MKEDFPRLSELPKLNKSQRRIGITGGIASGKTTIGNYLKDKKHLPIIDADLYAKEALQPQEVATEAIISRYGIKILKGISGKKEIDRSKLRKIIFSDQNERIWLENLIHPPIKRKLITNINIYNQEPIIILIIPLLFEANLDYLCTEIWCIYCSQDQQLQRLQKRDNLSKEDANKMINSQWCIEKKTKLSHAIIDNSNHKSIWKKQIDELIAN